MPEEFKDWYKYTVDEVKSMSTSKQIEFFQQFGFGDFNDYANEYELFLQLSLDGYTTDEALNLLQDCGAPSYSEDDEEPLPVDLMLVENEVAKNKNKGGNVGYTSNWTGGSSYSNSNSNTSTQSNFFQHRKSCPIHDGLNVVMSWKDKSNNRWDLAGAQGAEIEVDDELSLVIDLAGLFKVEGGKDSVRFTPSQGLEDDEWSKKMIELKSDFIPPPVLRIMHPDMGIPPVGWNFWQRLYDLLPMGRTVVACMGGHGRTGTVLACLILAGCKEKTGKDVIEYIRKHHCEKAIESDRQEDYIIKMATKRDEIISKEKANG